MISLLCAGLGEYISGSILFEETLYDNAATGESFVELMKKQGIIPGIKTDKVCINCDVPVIASLVSLRPSPSARNRILKCA